MRVAYRIMWNKKCFKFLNPTETVLDYFKTAYT